MDRRGFLKTTGAAAVAAGAATPAAAGSTDAPAALAITSDAQRLTLTSAWAAGLPGFDPARLARRIETATDGRFRIEAAALDTDSDLSFAYPSHATHPAFAFFAGLPGMQGLAAPLAHAWLAFGGGQMLWDELAAPFGFKPLAVGHTGASAGLWASVRLERPSDLSGIALHVAGLAGEVVRALGAAPVELAPEAVRPALANGRLAAAEWLGPHAAAAPDLQPLALRRYERGINHSGQMLALNVRKSLWDKLGAADQAIIEACAAQEFHLSLAEGRTHALIAREMATSAKWPLQVAFAPELSTALEQAAADVVHQSAEGDAQSRRIHDSYQAFRRLAGEPPTS